jgi:hypothetical protein
VAEENRFQSGKWTGSKSKGQKLREYQKLKEIEQEFAKQRQIEAKCFRATP